MNREQAIYIILGIFVLAGMILCPPVSIKTMSLYFWAGDPNAGLNTMTFYRFMPEGWPRCINFGVLLWQCFLLFVTMFCINFAFRKDIRKSTHNISKTGKVSSSILTSASILIFLLWFILASLKKDTLSSILLLFSELGLWIAGLFGLLTAFLIVNVYIDKKLYSQLLSTTIISCTFLTFCMIESLFWITYSPDPQMTPNMKRMVGILGFLGVWICFLIFRFIYKKLEVKEISSSIK